MFRTIFSHSFKVGIEEALKKRDENTCDPENAVDALSVYQETISNLSTQLVNSIRNNALTLQVSF